MFRDSDTGGELVLASKMKVYRGVTYDFLYNHKDTAGVAQTLVGHTVYFTVKDVEFDSDITDTTAKIQKTVTTHVDLLGVPSADAGITSFTLSDADTQIEPGDYYFDVIVADSAGKSLPPSLIGTFTVIPKPTNRSV